MAVLRENILDERNSPETSPADTAEQELGTPEEDFEFEAAARNILERVREDVRSHVRTDVDERLGEMPTVSPGQDWRTFALGIGVGAGLVYVSQIVGAILSHIAR